VKYRGSRDANHLLIVAAFESIGCSTADLALAGVNGFPDLVVGCAGRTHLVEVKNPETSYGRAGLNRDQSAFARDWRGGKVYVVETVEDVYALVQQWRKEIAAACIASRHTER
jgi:hypothetical protein